MSLLRILNSIRQSHDEAMVELEKKATEIQTYVDLKAQLESECSCEKLFNYTQCNILTR